MSIERGKNLISFVLAQREMPPLISNSTRPTSGAQGGGATVRIGARRFAMPEMANE